MSGLEVGISHVRIDELVRIDLLAFRDEWLDLIGDIPHIDVHRGEDLVVIIDPKRNELALFKVATDIDLLL